MNGRIIRTAWSQTRIQEIQSQNPSQPRFLIMGREGKQHPQMMNSLTMRGVRTVMIAMEEICEEAANVFIS